MLKFVIKGLLRDRTRSIFPILVGIFGVMISVYFVAFLAGFYESMIRQNSNLDTGHVKIVSRAYAEVISQKPYDLGLLEVSDELHNWEKRYPDMEFVPRISFAALLDIPDSTGLTLKQGNVGGLAIDLFSNDKEIKRLRLKDALRKGKIPTQAGEILVSDTLFNKLNLKLGQRITLIGSTVYGAMTLKDFKVTGAVVFGVQVLDRGGVIADLSDSRTMLDMENGASEILGFFTRSGYMDKNAKALALDFNKAYSDSTDEFSPLMLTLAQQNGLGEMIAFYNYTTGVMIFVFIMLMSIVLWNSGLLNGIRRYGEFGVRLAMGEQKKHLYWWLVMEASIIGCAGTIIGTSIGLLVSGYFQTHGVDLSSYSTNSTLLFENIIYTKITPTCWFIGFIPGLAAIIAGAMLAGISIYQRKTSQLFKELEA